MSITLHLANTDINVQVNKEQIISNSKVLCALLDGGFAESDKTTIELNLPENLTSDAQHAWIHFWSMMVNEIDITILTTHLLPIAYLTDMYEVDRIKVAIIALFHTGTIAVSHSTLEAADKIDALTDLLCPPTTVPLNNDEIPTIIAESCENPIELIRIWYNHSIGCNKSPFLDITDSIWPAAVGASICCDIPTIIHHLCDLAEGQLGTAAEFTEFLKTNPDIVVAGGALLAAVTNRHDIGDIDLWFCDSINPIIPLETQANAALKFCTQKSTLLGYSGSVATLINCKNNIPIQLIHTNSPDVRNILNEFDLSCVQIGLQFGLGAGTNCKSDTGTNCKSDTGTNFESSNGRLFCSLPFIETIITSKNAIVSVDNIKPYRIKKYIQRGFAPPDAVIIPADDDAEVIAAELRHFTFVDEPISCRDHAILMMRWRQCNPRIGEIVYNPTTIAPDWLKNSIGKLISNYVGNPNDIQNICYNLPYNIPITDDWLPPFDYANEQPMPINNYKIKISPLKTDIPHILKDCGILDEMNAMNNGKIVDLIRKTIDAPNKTKNIIFINKHGLTDDRYNINVNITKTTRIIDADTCCKINKMIFDTTRPVFVKGFLKYVVMPNLPFILCSIEATDVILYPNKNSISNS